jgi:hypothetical protein
MRGMQRQMRTAQISYLTNQCSALSTYSGFRWRVWPNLPARGVWRSGGLEDVAEGVEDDGAGEGAAVAAEDGVGDFHGCYRR